MSEFITLHVGLDAGPVKRMAEGAGLVSIKDLWCQAQGYE